MPLTGQLFAALLSAGAAAATPPKLSEFKDHNPVAVIFAPTADDPRFVQEAAQLAKLTAQPPFQSLIVVGVADTNVVGVSDSAAALRSRFGVSPKAFRLVLVGKGGQLALSDGTVATAAVIGRAITSAPMRQDVPRSGQPG